MNIKETALEIMTEVCETEEISEDLNLNLFDAGYIDSLSVINIILSVENKLNLKLQPTDLQKEDISTVNNFEAFLRKKLQVV